MVGRTGSFLRVFSMVSMVLVLGLSKPSLCAQNGLNANSGKQKSYISGGALEPVKLVADPGHFSSKPVVLEGILLRKQDAKATIMICHGFSCDKSDFSCLRSIFANHPYNVLIFDFRGHGKSSKDTYCTFGQDESLDVLSAVRFIKSDNELKKIPVIAFGWSMGAVATVEAQAKDPSAFSALVLDSPFDSSDSVIKRGIEKLKLSVCGYDIPIPGRKILERYSYNAIAQRVITIMFRLFAGFETSQFKIWIRKVVPSEAIKKVDVPVFIIGCMNDEKIPIDSFLKVYKSSKNYKRCWLTDGRRHCDSFFFNPEKYGHKVNKFIERVLSGDAQKIMSGLLKKKARKIIDDCDGLQGVKDEYEK